MHLIVRTALVAALGLAPALASARSPVGPIYAQSLVGTLVEKNPDLLNVLMHVTPPNGQKNEVVAAEQAKSIGEVSGDDDLGVMHNGLPLVEVQKDGVRIGVVVQMRDRSGHAIGALGLVYPWHAGQDQRTFLNRSETIRDELSRQIASHDALFQKA